MSNPTTFEAAGAKTTPVPLAPFTESLTSVPTAAAPWKKQVSQFAASTLSAPVATEMSKLLSIVSKTPITSAKEGAKPPLCLTLNNGTRIQAVKR